MCGSQISEKYWDEVGKRKRVDVYLEVRKRMGHIFLNETSAVIWWHWHWEVVSGMSWLTSLHFSVKQLYQFGAQMRLWFISLTISTLSHPTVLWSWCPHPTVLSVWWSNEIVTYFTHFLYTLVSNCFIRSQIVWCSNGTTTHTTLNVNVTTCLFIWAGVIVKFQKGNMP
jgi:hypothetical protein